MILGITAEDLDAMKAEYRKTLDDSFSAVDAKTENAIIDTLLRLDSTLVVATHRLAIVERLDRVIVLHEGRVVEDGKPSDLMKKDGEFARLWRKQRLTESLQAAS